MWNHIQQNRNLPQFVLTSFWKKLTSYCDTLGLEACQFCSSLHRSVDKKKNIKSHLHLRKYKVLLWQGSATPSGPSTHITCSFSSQSRGCQRKSKDQYDKRALMYAWSFCPFAFFQEDIRFSWGLIRTEGFFKDACIITELACLHGGLKYKMTNNLI